MIYIGFDISNPWSKQDFEVVCELERAVTKNKSIDINLHKNKTILSASFGISARQDHSGFTFDIGLFGYQLDVFFYDNRHWNERKSGSKEDIDN